MAKKRVRNEFPDEYYSPNAGFRSAPTLQEGGRPIDWEKPALIAGAAAVPAVGATYLYGKGLGEQGVPRGGRMVEGKWVPDLRSPGIFRSARLLGREVRAGTYGSITGTMREGVGAFWRGRKSAAKQAWSSLKHATEGAAHGLDNSDPLVRLNATLDGLIEFARLPSFAKRGGPISPSKFIPLHAWPREVQEGAIGDFQKEVGKINRARRTWMAQTGKKMPLMGTPILKRGPVKASEISRGRPQSWAEFLKDPNKFKKQRFSSKLDGLIEFAEDDRRRYATPAQITAGVGGAGATLAGYGLYQRGVATPANRTKLERYAERTGKKRFVVPSYSYMKPAQRGIVGNIAVGYKSVRNQAGIAAQLAGMPEIRKAYAGEARKSVSKSLERLAKYVHP